MIIGLSVGKITKVVTLASAGYVLRTIQEVAAASPRFDWTPVIVGGFALATIGLQLYGAYKMKKLELSTRDLDAKVEEVKVVAKQTEVSTNSTASALKAIADEREMKLRDRDIENATLRERNAWLVAQAPASATTTPSLPNEGGNPA